MIVTNIQKKEKTCQKSMKICDNTLVVLKSKVFESEVSKVRKRLKNEPIFLRPINIHIFGAQ